ncbi:uncharacterized protein [Malus domestica]|uniref:uncharacterized protein isoform X2 n=1 Tax=Malus domestica TaxID=3750 RepID=UPI0039754814
MFVITPKCFKYIYFILFVYQIRIQSIGSLFFLNLPRGSPPNNFSFFSLCSPVNPPFLLLLLFLSVMSLSLLSDLSQLPYLSSQPRTHARNHLPCARKTPHRRHLVLLPLCPVLQPQETRKGTPVSSYFPGEDEIEAGCRHTHLRRLSREFPAKPWRVGRRASFRRPPRLSRQFPAKPRRVRRHVSGVSVFASCVTFRRRSTVQRVNVAKKRILEHFGAFLGMEWIAYAWSKRNGRNLKFVHDPLPINNHFSTLISPNTAIHLPLHPLISPNTFTYHYIHSFHPTHSPTTTSTHYNHPTHSPTTTSTHFNHPRTLTHYTNYIHSLQLHTLLSLAYKYIHPSP